MKANQVGFPISLLCHVICTVSVVSGEQLYIVTSPDSLCPTREQGEPCLTLEQYTTNPSRSSTVTLVMEPGNHALKESRHLTSSTVANFTMVSEDAKIIFEFTGWSILDIQGYVRLSGITFSSSNSMYAGIEVSRPQEVIFQDCNFQGIGIYMYSVGNATFSRCNISDYNYGYFRAALYIYSTAIISFVQSNFVNNTGAVYFQQRSYYSAISASLVIMRCNFVNNTSDFFGGGAIYVSSDYLSVIISQSTFIYNTANRNQEVYAESRGQGGGGAINFDGTCTNCTISRSIFISNSARYCGALSCGSIFGGSNDIIIIDSAFYYNRAVNNELGVGGGAACINDASVSITNSTFVGNSAVGYGGAVVLDNSTITITDTVFSGNTAGLSGGALITYTYPSNYTISSSTFIDNRAGDDGGALFIGRSRSNVIVESSNILLNHAADRGGAIAVFGSSVIVYYGTNIYDNTANVGQVISACSSQISLPVVASRRPDPNFFLCTAYDDEIRFSTPTFQELPSFQNITLLVNEIIRENDVFGNPMINVSGSDSQQFQSINRKLHQAIIIVYISLTLSVILTVVFLLLSIATFMVYCKLRHSKLESKSKSLHNVYEQSESVYEDNMVDDTKGIEMHGD